MSDLNEVKEISDQQFGINYLTKSDLKSYFTSLNSRILIAIEDKMVVGFSIYVMGNFEIVLDEIGREHYGMLKSLGTIRKFHLHKTTAVIQNYVNRGIGSTLVQNAFNAGKAQCLLSMIWKRKIDLPMYHIITKLGFKSYCEIADYWCKSSLAKSYDCPECGKPPCNCSLIVMIK